MGSYYSPYEASSSDMLHTQHPTDFEMDHFLSMGGSPALAPQAKGFGGGMKELSDSLDADVGGRTVRAGRVSMFGDLVPISEGYAVPVSESLAAILGPPSGEEMSDANLVDSFLQTEHPPQGARPGENLTPQRGGSDGGALGMGEAGHQTRDFIRGAQNPQPMFEGLVGHPQGAFEGSVYKGSVFEGSTHQSHGFEGSAHGGQGLASSVRLSQGFEGSAHGGQGLEGSVHNRQGFEGSAHGGQAFEGSVHRLSQGFESSGRHNLGQDGVKHKMQRFEGSGHGLNAVQGFEGSTHGGQAFAVSEPFVSEAQGAKAFNPVQVFSTMGHGFSTSFAASDASLGGSLHGAEHFHRTMSGSLAGSSDPGGSSHGGEFFSDAGDGSVRGGVGPNGLPTMLVQGAKFLPNGQRMCAWRGCNSGARGRTAFCVVHGGGKKCTALECESAAEGRTKYCKMHGGGKKCQMEGCPKSAEGKAQMCIAHGGGRRCKTEGCTHSARGSSGLCIRHGGGKRCQRENCQRSAEGHTQLCISHGGGRRCQALGCTKGAQGSTNFCKAHGGGRRCVMPGCTKGAEGRTPFCKAHGGGNRCSYQGGQACTRSVHGGTKFCVAHGGGKRCKFLGCTKSARGRTDFCVRHGGGKRCVAPGCDKSAQGKTDLCKAHGGGKKCQYKADDFLSPCERFARGKTGLCAAHMALMKKKEKEREDELGVAETVMQLGVPGAPPGLWMRAGGDGPEANQLFYHVFSTTTNEQFALGRPQLGTDLEDHKLSYYSTGGGEESGKFGEGRVRGGGGAGQLLTASLAGPSPAVSSGLDEMDVQKLDEINASRQAEVSRIISLYNQNASPEVRHMIGAAHETLALGGGVFGWASHPPGGQEGVAESGPESIGGSSSGRLTDALFAEAYPGSGDERVRGESSVLTWLQSGIPLERLSNYGFSDSGSSHGGTGGSTHAGSLFTSHFGGGSQKGGEPLEGSKHGGNELGLSRGFGGGHGSMQGSNSGKGNLSKTTGSSQVFDHSQGVSSRGSSHMGALNSQGSGQFGGVISHGSVQMGGVNTAQLGGVNPHGSAQMGGVNAAQMGGMNPHGSVQTGALNPHGAAQMGGANAFESAAQMGRMDPHTSTQMGGLNAPQIGGLNGHGFAHSGGFSASHLGGGLNAQMANDHGAAQLAGLQAHQSAQIRRLSGQGLPDMEAFLAGFAAGRGSAKRGGVGPSLSTGAVRDPPRGGGFQSFSDGGVLARRPFKPDLRGWEFGVQGNPESEGSQQGARPSGMGSLRKHQEQQEWLRSRASGDVTMMEQVQSLSSPLWLADNSTAEMLPPRNPRVPLFPRDYQHPFIAGRSREDVGVSDPGLPRRFGFADQDSDQETSTFAGGSIITQSGLGEDESVRGGNAFYPQEPLETETLNHLMLRDEPEQAPVPGFTFAATTAVDSPVIAPLPKSLEGLGPDDLGPELEHGTFSGMMASIINNSPLMSMQSPLTSMVMHKIELPGTDIVLEHE